MSVNTPCPSGTWTGSRSANWADYTGQAPGKTGSEPGKWLVAVQDDASRKIMGHGVFSECYCPTARHSIEVLKHAMGIHGVP